MSRERLVIAIDGPAGSGKSTVAKALAKKLGYLYIDTGAMYRAVTLAGLRQGIDFEDPHRIAEVAESSKIELAPGEPQIKVMLDGENIENLIRTPEVSWLTSQKTANSPGVRERLVTRQRELGAAGGVVMEGRDIGTVVFPDADLKVYFQVSVEERTRRRIADFEARGIPFDPDLVRQEIEKRDREDQGRPQGALKKARGAVDVLGDGKPVETILSELVGLLPKDIGK